MSTIKTDMNIKEWSEFESALEELSASGRDMRKSLVELKSRIVGDDVMSDRQHRMIIALFVCELQWNAVDAWKFIAKTIPAVNSRLGKKATRETDLSIIYQKINKQEASKLITILKSIAGRKKK